MAFTEKEIESNVSFLKILNFLAITSMILLLIFRNPGLNLKLLEDIIRVIFGVLFFMGLTGRKKYTIPLAFLSITIGLVQIFIYSPLLFLVLIRASKIYSLVILVGLLFFIYWTYFFTRKEVKEYFGYKNISLWWKEIYKK